MHDRQFGWVIVALVVAAAIVLRGDLSHYTWWMVIEFWAVSLLACFDLDHLFAIVFLSQSLLVLLGVVGMSLVGCSMLRDTATDLGLVYVPLNFMVHYAPSLAVIAYPPRKPISDYSEQLVTGAAIFVAYALVHNATEVYGCIFRRGTVPLVFTIASFAAAHPRVKRFWLSTLTPEGDVEDADRLWWGGPPKQYHR
jgi:hypothetical protein